MTINLRNSTVALSLCAGLVGMLAAPSAFGSVVLASDNFNSDTVAALNGQSGGTGWAGAWVDGGTVNAQVVATGGSDSPMSGNAVRLTGNDSAAATRTLATTVSGNVIVNFDFQFDAGTVTNNDFMGLWFGSSSGPNIGLKANCGSGCAADLFVRTTGSGGSFFQNIAVGTTYSLMGYLQKTGGSLNYNQFDFWVNPTAFDIANLTGADVFATGNSGIASFNQIGFRTVNLATGDALLIDNLSLSRVPEPGILALMGLGLAGLALTRRRKSARQLSSPIAAPSGAVFVTDGQTADAASLTATGQPSTFPSARLPMAGRGQSRCAMTGQ